VSVARSSNAAVKKTVNCWKPKTKVMAISSEAQLAWLAGFVDGEGNIGIYRNNGRRYRNYVIRVCVVNTHKPSMARVADLMDAALVRRAQNHKGWKSAYVVSITGKKAAAVLEKLLPHLVTKKRQAKVVLAVQAVYANSRLPRKGRAGYPGVAPEACAFAEKAYWLIKKMNTKGVVNVHRLSREGVHKDVEAPSTQLSLVG